MCKKKCWCWWHFKLIVTFKGNRLPNYIQTNEFTSHWLRLSSKVNFPKLVCALFFRWLLNMCIHLGLERLLSTRKMKEMRCVWYSLIWILMCSTNCERQRGLVSCMVDEIVRNIFYYMTRTAPRALSLQNYWENPRMRAVRDGASRSGKSRPDLLGSRTALIRGFYQ